MDKIEIQVWVAINENGDFVVNTDSPSDAHSELEAAYTNDASRVYAFTLMVAPANVVEVSAEIPDTDGPVTVTVG
jgi:hypothetical protein